MTSDLAHRLHEWPDESSLGDEPATDASPKKKSRYQKTAEKLHEQKQEVRDLAIEDKWPIVLALCLHWVRR